MKREFRLTGAHVRRPAGRTDPDQYNGIEVGIVSGHLKSAPVDMVRLSEDEALRLAVHLVSAVRYRRPS